MYVIVTIRWDLGLRGGPSRLGSPPNEKEVLRGEWYVGVGKEEGFRTKLSNQGETRSSTDSQGTSVRPEGVERREVPSVIEEPTWSVCPVL